MYQTFLVMSNFTGFSYFVPKILSKIVAMRKGKLTAVIARLVSKCLWTALKW